MSWSFTFVGTAEAVTREVSAFDQHLDVGEHAAMVATKQAILAHVSLLDSAQGVRVEAFGSNYNHGNGEKHANASMKVDPCRLSL